MGSLNMRSMGAIVNSLPPGYELFPDVTIWKLHPYGGAGYTTLPLWQRGTYNSGLQIPAGTWELHVFFEWSAAEGGYAIAISVKMTGVPSAYVLQCSSDRYEASGSFDDRLDFNMGVMPSGTVTVERVKAHSTNFYTVQLPPQEDW